MVRFQVGERLGKTLAELAGMTEAELLHWIAYFKLQARASEYNKSQN